MLIDDEIRHLVEIVETDPSDEVLTALIGKLSQNCDPSKNKDAENETSQDDVLGALYPVDTQGYAIAYDPIFEEQAFTSAWKRYGFVVGKAIATPKQCSEAITGIKSRFKAISHNLCDIDRPETWHDMPHDRENTPLLSRGFLEIYHDDILAQLRQNIRAYIHHVLIWQRTDLWTSFDRVGVKLPHHTESKDLPLHVDQNPLIHPQFRTIQGVLALTNCPAERGTFVAVPASRRYFSIYGEMARNNGEYVELDLTTPLARELQAHTQPIPLRAGHMVTWDSRTTHANTDNTSDQARMVLYMAAGPSQYHISEAQEARLQAFQSGVGSNLRDALMHASKKPRFTNPNLLALSRRPERLNILGKCLYGIESYTNIASTPAP